MRMRYIASLVTLLALGFPAVAAPPILRDSPEFTIVPPSDKTSPLSTFKGPLVVIEFLLYRRPSCLPVPQTITKLHPDIADPGFRPIAIVFTTSLTHPTL